MDIARLLNVEGAGALRDELAAPEAREVLWIIGYMDVLRTLD